mmetsp:Transcript_13878/g.35713  ORF Transcript_13878/g.35713 Transcript_13878/m.35713 type:complete len:388 (-) Transcript_13878:149-1312(-)|eukprot:CAMPEP_0206306278 /NCGR_PEP_ID=MMETSP0106_2-20121207/10713_1 /ASSEMBLY_ACC=CAM_ASM_000206 /TAXON_ID=81532 /ORGANISM="Acanthoeca-like sp., Strain 10tr" /LENGTH=387 /DNA_ID=CAMNT_0053737185 /DNA_START=378 /DNA_END=1541 /DNA_ORIENTATION=-
MYAVGLRSDEEWGILEDPRSHPLARDRGEHERLNMDGGGGKSKGRVGRRRPGEVEGDDRAGYDLHRSSCHPPASRRPEPTRASLRYRYLGGYGDKTPSVPSSSESYDSEHQHQGGWQVGSRDSRSLEGAESPSSTASSEEGACTESIRHGRHQMMRQFHGGSRCGPPTPDVKVGPKAPHFSRPLKSEDVVVVPEFFCAEDDLSIYFRLVEEMRVIQAKKMPTTEWIPWHKGCHLLNSGLGDSPTIKRLLQKATDYFGIELSTVGAQMNWSLGGKDWQSVTDGTEDADSRETITVGFSFGGERELAFVHTESGARAHFPQANGMMFSFGRDTSIKWQHGIDASPPSGRTGTGRISIVLWGKVRDGGASSDSSSSSPSPNSISPEQAAR